MTTNPNDARDALRRLADSLAEDILNAPDEQVLADAAEIYGDTDKLAAAMRRLFEETAGEQGKARLRAARADIGAARKVRAIRPRRNADEARRLLQKVIAADPETARKLTMAARKGEGLSDEDVISMLEDFEELGLVESPDPKGPKP